MVEGKIKVKDLLTELDVPSKDMLRALRELGLPAKSTAGFLSLEDASRLRGHFESRKEDSVERTTVQPNVIVRRRRKEGPTETPASVAETAALVVEEVTVQDTGTSLVVTASSEIEIISSAPLASKESENVGSMASSASKEGESPEATKVRPPKSPRGRQPSVDAKVISRPAPEVKPSATKDENRKNEPSLAASEPRISPILSAISDKVAPKEASEAAEVSREQKAAPNKPETDAVRGPEAEVLSKSPVSSQDEKSAKPSRHARPDASASPEGSSAPTLLYKEARGSENEDLKQRGEQGGAVSPKVRVISRPSPGMADSRPRTEAAASPGRSQGAYRQESRQPGATRPGAERPGSPGYRNGARSGATAGGYAQASKPGFTQAAPGQSPDGREGQSKKKRLKGRRTVDFQQGDFGRREGDEDNLTRNRNRAKRKSAKPVAQPQVTQPIKAAKRKLRIAEAIRVADMAHQMGLKANEIIKVLFGLGVMATINQSLDIETATLVAAEFEYEVEKTGFAEEDFLTPKEADAPESLKSRPPVVTIMGHVDHGKTSLLDAIRQSNITSGEAGGITQHIGAYHVKTKRGEIVFLDTPGHEAFTAMRARGAQVTDLVILVVAADDGVMEQTREAISHSRAANVPIMVAVNKMDKPGADPDRVLRELAEIGLQPEDWGGDTIVAKVSAKTRAGLDDLLELVALQSEIMDLKANPDKFARGHIVEARLDKGRGPIATVLIQEGTLHHGDNFVCGPFSGRVRALNNDQGRKVNEAGPSMPVEVLGFEGVPEAGEEFLVVADDKLARRIADSRAIKLRERELASESRVTLETFLAKAKDSDSQTLNLVLKADVQGSLEAITEALLKQSTDKVKLNIVHGGTGAISESDILLASASQAIIIGFNVRPTAKIKDIAERENVDIRFYDIIYKLVDDVKSAMTGMLAPIQREVYLGQAEVREIFSVPKVGNIAGSYVADGKITRNAGVRLLRDGVVVYTGRIASLKRFKDDAREVLKGNECGVGLENFNDVKIADIIEAFETVQEAASL